MSTSRRDHSLSHKYLIKNNRSQSQDHIVHEHCHGKKNIYSKKTVDHFSYFASVWAISISDSFGYRSAASLEMLNLNIAKKNNICFCKKKLKKLEQTFCHGGDLTLNTAARCLHHIVIPNPNHVSERIPMKFPLLNLSGHLWQGYSSVRVEAGGAVNK